jgi:RNA polymerase sigma-70 factor (ECF subfamily)
VAPAPDPLRPSDQDLVCAARAGSCAAFTELVARHELGLFRFLRLRLGRVDLAEEVQQDTFVRCWTRLHLYDGARSFTAWLYRMAANLANNQRRQRRHDATQPIGEVPGGVDPALELLARDARANLWEVAQRVLPAETCSALWLFYAERLSAAAIGEILGRSEGAVRVLMHRARERLAPLLTPSELSLEVR